MLAIKLKRIGKKHQPAYRIVVNEKRSKATGGTSIEELGWMDPASKKHVVDAERVLYWIQNGAQPTPSVHNLLLKAHILKGSKKPVHGTSAAPAEAAPVMPTA